ncbi:hypothetical protein ACTQ4E_09945 [Lawsonibacter sp. LCP25S3_G6]|uniref:hypothetical protein n=1 Tax=unclassified Lawsonibacter TaxID=2617946 RepID=UPI003F98E7EE
MPWSTDIKKAPAEAGAFFKIKRESAAKQKRHLQKADVFFFVRWLQSGYFALESLHRNGLQISGKKYSQFF